MRSRTRTFGCAAAAFFLVLLGFISVAAYYGFFIYVILEVLSILRSAVG